MSGCALVGPIAEGHCKPPHRIKPKAQPNSQQDSCKPGSLYTTTENNKSKNSYEKHLVINLTAREAMDKAINHSLEDQDLEFSHSLAPSLVPDHPPYPSPINKTPNPKYYTPKNPGPTPSTYETLKESKKYNVTPTNQMNIRKNRPTHPVDTAPPRKPLCLQGSAPDNPKKAGYITIAALKALFGMKKPVSSCCFFLFLQPVS